MERPEFYAVLTDCIRSKVSQLQVSDILETHDLLLDLGADSLEAVEILTCTMKRTGVKIPPTEVSHLMTVGEALDLFEKYGTPKGTV